MSNLLIFTDIKYSHLKGPAKEFDKINKADSENPSRTRIQAYIKGSVRGKFFKDSAIKNISESKLNEMILKVHYALIDEYPLLSGLEYEDVNKMSNNALKKYIIDKITFK